jgi:hypothetical protein
MGEFEMNTNGIISILAVAAGLLLNSGLGNAADVYARKTNAAINLSSTGGIPTNLLAVNVPAGTWKVSAKASVVNFGDKDYVRCTVVSSTALVATQIDAAATMTGELAGMPSVATIANVGVITTTVPTTFRLSCQHDFNIAGQYVDPDAKLIVERVSSGTSSL